MFFVNLSCYFKIAEQNKCWKIISNNSCFLSHQSIHEHYQIVPLWSLYKHKKFTTNQRGMIDVCTPVLWVLFLRMTVNILLFLSSMDLNYHTRKSQHSFFFFSDVGYILEYYVCTRNMRKTKGKIWGTQNILYIQINSFFSMLSSAI